MTANAKIDSISTREARVDDAPELAELCGQLGYPTTTDQVIQRMKDMFKSPGHAVFVAQTEAGAVAGFISLQVMRLVEADARAEVTALVVDDEYRSRGVGQVLVARGEDWARAQSCSTIGLRSNVIRERAHSFYGRLGYQHVKTQKAFRKAL